MSNDSSNDKQAHPSTRFARWGKVGRIVKDWITTIVALAALGLGLLNFYIARYQENDDLRLVVSYLPKFKFDEVNSGIAINDDKLTLIFINAGNRSSVIIAVEFELRACDTSQSCQSSKFSVDTDVVVIKEKEIATRNMELRGWKAGQSFLAVPREEHPFYYVDVLLTFTIATPSVASVTRTVQVHLGIHPPNGGGGSEVLRRPYTIWPSSK